MPVPFVVITVVTGSGEIESRVMRKLDIKAAAD
jgi:hypothetical protein